MRLCLQDCVFHPEQSLVAAGLVNGQLRVYDCSGAEPSQSLSLKAHKDSCRTLAFAKEGSALVSGSVDLSILVYDLAAEKALARLSDAHEAAVNRRAIFPIQSSAGSTSLAP